MKPRRSIPVTQYTALKPDSLVTIKVDRLGVFVLFNALGGLVASCASAKRLSDWAFEESAREVKHDYNLKLSDGEM